MVETVEETSLAGLRLLRRGKVRDVYDLGDRLLLVATDRVSAFDRVLPTPIPDKGRVLTQLSRFWFRRTEGVVPNHLISTRVSDFPAAVQSEEPAVRDRSMLVRKTRSVEVECVVRGYIGGSAWKEYEARRTVGGEPFAPGLVEFSPLTAPAFTPAVKRHEGHDENISFAELGRRVGTGLADRLRDLSIRLYEEGHAHAADRGLVLADAKFEFGWDGERLILIDELLTPDSSRFWLAETYEAGRKPDSTDKQIVRDYVASLGWDGSGPAPELPRDLVAEVRARYLDVYRRIVGSRLP